MLEARTVVVAAAALVAIYVHGCGDEGGGKGNAAKPAADAGDPADPQPPSTPQTPASPSPGGAPSPAPNTGPSAGPVGPLPAETPAVVEPATKLTADLAFCWNTDSPAVFAGFVSPSGLKEEKTNAPGAADACARDAAGDVHLVGGSAIVRHTFKDGGVWKTAKVYDVPTGKTAGGMFVAFAPDGRLRLAFDLGAGNFRGGEIMVAKQQADGTYIVEPTGVTGRVVRFLVDPAGRMHVGFHKYPVDGMNGAADAQAAHASDASGAWVASDLGDTKSRFFFDLFQKPDGTLMMFLFASRFGTGAAHSSALIFELKSGVWQKTAEFKLPEEPQAKMRLLLVDGEPQIFHISYFNMNEPKLKTTKHRVQLLRLDGTTARDLLIVHEQCCQNLSSAHVSRDGTPYIHLKDGSVYGVEEHLVAVPSGETFVYFKLKSSSGLVTSGGGFMVAP